MRLNKLILPVALITPLFASSCKGDGKYSGVTIDAQEMIFAYSQECSTTLTISDSLSDVEFVDDFKSEYFTFDNPADFEGKEYTVSKTSSKKLTVTFTKAYTGHELSQTESKEIKYKINKSAFKNNVMINDATGKMAMTWDSIHPQTSSAGHESIIINFLFTQDSVPSTQVTLDSQFTTEITGTFSEYCSPVAQGATIKFSKTDDESGKVYLCVKLECLPSDGMHAFTINVHNTNGKTLFSNLPPNCGLEFHILNNGAGTDYYLNEMLSNAYFKLKQ